MAPWWGLPANPHAATHKQGIHAGEAVRTAQKQIGDLVGGPASGVIFTSGATEANHLAILGALNGDPRRDLVIGGTEHACVRAAADLVRRQGRRVHILKVRDDAAPDPSDLSDLLERCPGIGLVSVMAVNNEMAAVTDLAAIGALTRRAGVVFHTDAAQAPWRLRISMREMGIDLLSLAAGKIGGPPGIGALVRLGDPPVAITPRQPGGGQQGGLRGGTVPTALAVGFGSVASQIIRRFDSLVDHLAACERACLDGLEGSGIILNGPPAGVRAPGLLSLTMPDHSAEDVVMSLPECGFASGAACSSEGGKPSACLTSLGLSADAIHRTLRVSFAPDTTIRQAQQVGTDLLRLVEYRPV